MQNITAELFEINCTFAVKKQLLYEQSFTMLFRLDKLIQWGLLYHRIGFGKDPIVTFVWRLRLSSPLSTRGQVGFAAIVILFIPVINIGIKHGFSCINIRQVPREVLKTEAGGRGFQHLPRDLATVNALKNHVRSLLLHKN